MAKLVIASNTKKGWGQKSPAFFSVTNFSARLEMFDYFSDYCTVFNLQSDFAVDMDVTLN